MKTLKEIRNSEAKSRYGQSYNDCLEWVDRKELSQMDEQIAKEFALEVAKVSLKNAADNAKITGDWDNEAHDVVHSVDKKSILSENNIPKL